MMSREENPTTPDADLVKIIHDRTYDPTPFVLRFRSQEKHKAILIALGRQSFEFKTRAEAEAAKQACLQLLHERGYA